MLQMAHSKGYVFWAFMTIGFTFLVIDPGECNFTLSTRHMKIQTHHLNKFYMFARNLTSENASSLTIEFVPQHEDILQVTPRSLQIIEVNYTSFNYTFIVHALSAGKSEITAVSSSIQNGVEDVFLSVEVYKSRIIEEFSNIVGWIYFLAWGASYYPQIYTNFKRKSVVGLNFDYLAFNIIGYAMYTVFNLGLYYVPEAKEEYFRRHPRSLNAVLPNDLFFVIHGTAAGIICGIQALMYERRHQTLSLLGQGICGMYGLTFSVAFILVLTQTIHLLDFLYVCSYIKLVVTVTKYVPQAYMNYSRKSTDGWSIGNVLLDFVGGIGSLLQMFLNAYNYHDVHSVTENPTKFGLAVLTIIFDLLFMAQHYLWYNQKPDREEEQNQVEENIFIKKV